MQSKVKEAHVVVSLSQQGYSKKKDKNVII